MGIPVLEAEADSPPVVNGHGPLSGAIALEFVQAHTFQRTQVLQIAGGIQCRKQLLGGVDIQTPEGRAFPIGIKALRGPVRP